MSALRAVAIVACVAVFVVGVSGFFVADTARVVADVASVVAAVSFLVWLWRARLAAAILCDDARFNVSPRMTIVWWFIPIASSLMPLKAMREVVEASKAAATSQSYWRTQSPTWVGLWWVLWLASAFVDAVTVESTDAAVVACRGSIDVAAAAFCIVVVASVTRWQETAWKKKRAA